MEQDKNTKKELSAPLITQMPNSLQSYNKRVTKEMQTKKEAIDKQTRESLEA